MLDQLSNIGVDERERLSRNPYLQYAQQPSTKDKFLSGLASGLNRFAETKLQQMEAANRAKGWQSLGLNPEVASFISQQSPELQKDFFNRLENIPVGSVPVSAKEGNVSPEGLKLGLSKEGHKQKLENEKEKADKFKASADLRNSIIQDRKNSRGELRDLNRLEELDQTGKLDTAGYVEFLKNSGLDIPALLNPESQEFQKIQQGFLKNIKQYFTGNISNYEVQQFLTTIPTLSQSPEGRKRVISGLKYVARAKEEYYKTYEEVLKEHGGVPPYDIQEEIERRIDPKIEKLAQKFREDLAKPVPEGQNKIITALQAGAGKVVGNSGKILGGLAGAAGGALTGGRVAGIPGAAIGGVLGGLTGLKNF